MYAREDLSHHHADRLGCCGEICIWILRFTSQLKRRKNSIWSSSAACGCVKLSRWTVGRSGLLERRQTNISSVRDVQVKDAVPYQFAGFCLLRTLVWGNTDAASRVKILINTTRNRCQPSLPPRIMRRSKRKKKHLPLDRNTAAILKIKINPKPKCPFTNNT